MMRTFCIPPFSIILIASFLIALSTATGATLGTPASAVLTITNDDTAPDTTAPAISITSPTTGSTYSTTTSTLNLGGTASDNRRE